MIARRFALCLVLLVVTAGAGGCAFGDRMVTLSYPPQAEEGAVSAAHAATAPAQSRGQAVLAPFADGRAKSDTIGDVRNAYGMHTADVLASNSVEEWVAKAVSMELEQAGFAITDASSSHETSGNAVISGEVSNVYTTAYFTYKAEVSFYGRVQKGRAILLDELYTGAVDVGTNWAATAESYGRSLSLALQKAARDFVADIKKLDI